MKKLLSVFFMMLILLFGCAGMQSVSEGPIEKIVSVRGFSKNQIFDRTKIYIAENFRSTKAVLEYENKETGTIIGNGKIKYPATGFGATALKDWTVNFTMRVDIKDGRFRCTFSNLRLLSPESYDRISGVKPRGEREIKTEAEYDEIKAELLKIPDKIKAYVIGSKQTDNW